MPACSISGQDYEFTSSTLADHPEQYFFLAANRRHKFEAEGWITVSGPGSTPGAKVAINAPEGSIGEFSVSINYGAPVHVTQIGAGVGANVALGTHHYRIAGVLETSDLGGQIQLQLAKNNNNQGLVVSRQRCWMDGLVENASAEG